MYILLQIVLCLHSHRSNPTALVDIILMKHAIQIYWPTSGQAGNEIGCTVQSVAAQLGKPQATHGWNLTLEVCNKHTFTLNVNNI